MTVRTAKPVAFEESLERAEAGGTWGTATIITSGAIVATLFIYRQTIATMAAVWSSASYSHGFLVFPIVVCLVWLRRKQVRAVTPAPAYWLLPSFLLLSGVWLVAKAGDVKVVEQYAVIAMLPVLVCTTLGLRVARVLLFPLAFLFFAVPFGESLIPALQNFTAFFVVKALEFSNIPVLWEGNLLTLSSGSWMVAEACSGLRYLTATVVLGALFCSLAYRSWKRRAVFMLASVMVPIIANGLRAYAIILVGHFISRNLAIGIDHIIFGGVFFLLILVLLFEAGRRSREVPLLASPVSEERSLAVASTRFPAAATLFRGAALGVVIVAAAPAYCGVFWKTAQPHSIQLRAPTVTLPWKSERSAVDVWTPQFQGVNSELKQTYSTSAAQVQLYIGYYESQHPGAEVVSSINHLSTADWMEISHRNQAALVKGVPLRVRADVLRSSHGSRLAWSWYWVNGNFTADPYTAKWWQAKGRLLGRGDRAAVIVISTECRQSVEDANGILRAFLRHATIEDALFQ